MPAPISLCQSLTNPWRSLHPDTILLNQIMNRLSHSLYNLLSFTIHFVRYFQPGMFIFPAKVNPIGTDFNAPTFSHTDILYKLPLPLILLPAPPPLQPARRQPGLLHLLLPTHLLRRRPFPRPLHDLPLQRRPFLQGNYCCFRQKKPCKRSIH